ncbi:MAG: hypothetical protein QXW98_07655 [Candidatus Caldarchaeum sp.]
MTTTKERRYAAFILSYRRANKVYTYKTLRRSGYTGKIYIICDDEDDQLPRYFELYGDSVIVFNKQEAIDNTDSGDNFKKRNSVVYARNQSFKIAAELGLTHFLMLDDDYHSFRYTANHKGEYLTRQHTVKNMDAVVEAFFDFLDESGAYAIAFAQSRDFIGGGDGNFFKKFLRGKIHRKVMNAFFFRVDRPVKFMGRLNEDVNMYVEYGRRGYLLVTHPLVHLQQEVTQANKGGLTDIYLDLGTYLKSFYSVMYAPSCVIIADMGVKDRRIHHQILWKYAVPVILDEKYRKSSNAPLNVR